MATKELHNQSIKTQKNMVENNREHLSQHQTFVVRVSSTCKGLDPVEEAYCPMCL